MMTFSVRPARVEDGPALQAIEIAAGQRFAEVGMPEVAGDDPAALKVLAASARNGRAWSAVDDGDRGVGYLLASFVDGNAPIDQMSVMPEMQGLGIGRRLIDQVATWAREQGVIAITLTTFGGQVPWNQPLYEHLGFHVLEDEMVGPELQAIREHEVEIGLDTNVRVCMARAVG